jgi:ribose transport system permease protein
VPTSYEQFASSEFLGLTLPVWLVLVIAIVAWYVLDLTRLGRYIYATGGNIEAARLSGVRTSRIVFGSLVASGIGGTIAGLIITAQLDSGSPSVGPDYLLPSFAAVFLGATQFRVGRPNVWGTVLAVFVIAVGIKGLSIIGAPLYVGSIFDGAALIIAVSLTVLTNRRTGLAARMLPARFRRARVDIPSDDADGPAEVGAELPGETAGSQVRAEQ